MQQLDGGSVASLPVDNTQRVDSDAASVTNDQAEKNADGGSSSVEGESEEEAPDDEASDDGPSNDEVPNGEEAYMLELWEDSSSNGNGSTKSDDMSGTFTKKHFNDAEELRAGIDACTHRNEAASSNLGTKSSLRRRILVVAGSPEEYIAVLEKSLDLGVDQRFIHAHLYGERYRPTGPFSNRRPRAAGIAFINLQFPEIVEYVDRDYDAFYTRWLQDVTPLGEPTRRSIAGVSFCRASLWSNSTLDVLLLDRCVFSTDPSRQIPGLSFTMPLEDPYLAVRTYFKKTILFTWENSAFVDSFAQELVWLLTDHTVDTTRDPLTHALRALEACVVERWIQLLENLAATQKCFEECPLDNGTKYLYWSAIEYLVRNLIASKYADKTPSNPVCSEWEQLIERLERQVRMLNYFAPTEVISSQDDRVNYNHMATHGNMPVFQNDKQNHEDSKRINPSLERVTYLGGMLLPISLVAGMLSMNEEYSPGGDKFFVFWAAVIPLCFITVAIIHADTIRKEPVLRWKKQALTGNETLGAGESPQRRPPHEMTVKGTRPSSHGAAPSQTSHSPITSPVAPATPRPVTPASIRRVPAPAPPPTYSGVVAEWRFPSFTRGKRSSPRDAELEEQQLGWLGAFMSMFGLYKLTPARDSMV